jgi:hypothetical protein
MPKHLHSYPYIDFDPQVIGFTGTAELALRPLSAALKRQPPT